MIKSMTGYGRGHSQQGDLSFIVEIKAVNHRYSDITVKAPRIVTALENKIKKQIASVLKRGKIDVYITQDNRIAASARPVVNHRLAADYLTALQSLTALEHVGGEISLEFLASMPDVVKLEDVTQSEEQLSLCLHEALADALEAVAGMRAAEGAVTSVDMQERIILLKEFLVLIEQQAQTVPQEWERKLKDRLSRLQGVDADPQRVAQEIAVFADRCDISEELVRFRSHLQQFEELLQNGEPVGRQMDFLVQELNREVNTMGSKSNDAILTRYVVMIKSELEKIREQVQNIE